MLRRTLLLGATMAVPVAMLGGVALLDAAGAAARRVQVDRADEEQR